MCAGTEVAAYIFVCVRVTLHLLCNIQRHVLPPDHQLGSEVPVVIHASAWRITYGAAVSLSRGVCQMSAGQQPAASCSNKARVCLCRLICVRCCV
jgi:hypothetical protein